jgi:hypothetical protein
MRLEPYGLAEVRQSLGISTLAAQGKPQVQVCKGQVRA